MWVWGFEARKISTAVERFHLFLTHLMGWSEVGTPLNRSNFLPITPEQPAEVDVTPSKLLGQIPKLSLEGTGFLKK